MDPMAIVNLPPHVMRRWDVASATITIGETRYSEHLGFFASITGQCSDCDYTTWTSGNPDRDWSHLIDGHLSQHDPDRALDIEVDWGPSARCSVCDDGDATQFADVLDDLENLGGDVRSDIEHQVIQDAVERAMRVADAYPCSGDSCIYCDVVSNVVNAVQFPETVDDIVRELQASRSGHNG